MDRSPSYLTCHQEASVLDMTSIATTDELIVSDITAGAPIKNLGLFKYVLGALEAHLSGQVHVSGKKVVFTKMKAVKAIGAEKLAHFRLSTLFLRIADSKPTW